MAFDVSGLIAHIEENSLDFSTKAITGSKIWELGFDERQGIKAGTTTKVPILEQTAPFYAASSCAVNASGTTTISQVSLTTTSIAVSPEWCLNDLEAYFTQMGLGKGANTDSFSGMTKIMDRLAAQVARRVGMMMIQGKTTYTNDTALKQLNGLISIVDTAGTAIDGNTGAVTVGTGITTSNAIAIFDAIIAAIPNRVFGMNPVVICGMNDYRTLVAAQKAANQYNWAPTAADYSSLMQTYPLTNVKIIAIPELNNDNPVETGVLPTAVKNRIFALNTDNILIGMDKKSDIEEFDVWYDKNTRKLKSYMRFSLGLNAKFFDEIVSFKLV
jgi:hypothetical protein